VIYNEGKYLMMQKLLVLIIVFLMILGLFFIVVVFLSKSKKTTAIPEDKVYTTSYIFRIPENELPQKIFYALSGDSIAAEEVMNHYIYSTKDYSEAFKWHTIGAENGSFRAQYRHAGILLYYSNNDFDAQTRGIFWLYVMAKNGYEIERIEDSLNRYGYTISTAKPPEDNCFANNYVQFSKAELASLSDFLCK
jgi:hypothetical protein